MGGLDEEPYVYLSSVSVVLTYVGSNIHDSVSMVDVDAFLQVAVLFSNLAVDEHGLCFRTRWNLPAIWQHHKSLYMCCSTLLSWLVLHIHTAL